MRLLILLITLNLFGCVKNSEKALDVSELTSQFNEHEANLEKLKAMIIEDARDLDYFQIRDGKIGEYDQDNKGWSKDYGKYVPFSIVTGTYRLSGKRYEDYVRLLKATNSSAVNFYTGNVSITIFSAGFVFGGCSSEIIYQPEQIKLSRPSWAQTYHQVYFNSNWGGETRCN